MTSFPKKTLSLKTHLLMNSIGSLLVVGALALFNQKQVLKEYRQTVDENFVGYARSLQSKIAANPWLATGKPQDIVPLLNKYVQVVESTPAQCAAITTLTPSTALK